VAVPEAAQEKGTSSAKANTVRENPPTDACFDETQLHAGVSMDAFIGSNV
jgi:hypothetical protein